MRTAPPTIIAAAVLTLALLLPSGAVTAATNDPLTVRTDESAAIDGWVEDRMDARGVPGTAVAVVRGGDVVHLAGYGIADEAGRAVTPDTPFILGSASKPFTAVVVAQLAEELQDRVFDPLKMTGSFAAADDPRAEGMATGHRQWFGRWRPAELPYDNAGVAMGYIASTAQDLARFMQAHLDGHPAIPATAASIADGTVAPTGWSTTLDAGYGRGWFVDELAGTAVVTHPGSLGHFSAHVLLAPDADRLGIAVVSNASSFVAAGHEAQYDLGLGLLHMLLGEQPQPADPSLLMTFVVPVVAWVIVALLLVAVARHLMALRAHGLPAAAGTGARRWIRSLLPGALLLAVGAALLAAPLGLARHFYPDGGWAVTVLAYIAVGWGLARLGLGLRAAAPCGARPN